MIGYKNSHEREGGEYNTLVPARANEGNKPACLYAGFRPPAHQWGLEKLLCVSGVKTLVLEFFEMALSAVPDLSSSQDDYILIVHGLIAELGECLFTMGLVVDCVELSDHPLRGVMALRQAMEDRLQIAEQELLSCENQMKGRAS
ncbi:MAG: hypothetical protein OIF56_14920 [Cohaesibacter sp.]|nr:hypothetical protein [Cohaesibacter sp.]